MACGIILRPISCGPMRPGRGEIRLYLDSMRFSGTGPATRLFPQHAMPRSGGGCIFRLSGLGGE